jgi:hypothetical protein
MTTYAPGAFVALASAGCVAAAMIMLGLGKGLLIRRAHRLCPSCGRYVKPGSFCRCTCV